MVKYCDYDLGFFSESEYDVIRKYNPHTEETTEWINLEMSFDIETTSTEVNGEKFAFMYEWTFGIKDHDHICYGRTWKEFVKLCNQLKEHFKLSDTRHCVIYVHNLGYEFQFMRKYFNWVSVFATDERKPIRIENDLGIVFKDSYILSGYSLAKVAENLTSHKIKKLLGDLDYQKVRTSETYLYPNELEYCNNDVEIILDYINEQISIYGDITKIPLTNTGRVRQFVKKRCYQNQYGKNDKKQKAKYIRLMNSLTLTKETYLMLKDCFQGGFTHASLNYEGMLEKDIHSIDFTSSYPYSMLAEKYPMSRPIKVDVSKEDFNALVNSENIGLMFNCRLSGVHSRNTYESYISESKCKELKNPKVNNGRVFSADELTMTITDLDLKIIYSIYDIDKIEIGTCYKFIMDYLPKPIIMSILELYKDKTTLKGIPEKAVEYLLKKGMLNSIYGMCVTDIVRSEIIYDTDIEEWELGKKLTEDQIEEQIDIYNKSKSRFLYYPWGVWCTSWSRYHLWVGGINKIGNDYLYSDTDSIKFKNYEANKHVIEEYNKECDEKLKKMCSFYKIPFEYTRPKTVKGIEKPIGYFDYEGKYDYFKTLGAKRYMYVQDGELHITIAGLSKQNGARYLEYLAYKELNNKELTFDEYKELNHKPTEAELLRCFELFDNNLYIPSYATGKNTHTYIDNEMESDIIDYNGLKSHVHSRSSIHLSECEFTLSIADKYLRFIDNFRHGLLYIGETL